MTATTVEVSSELRDRLKQQASGAGLTLGQHLASLADLTDRDARLRGLRRAIAQTSSGHMASWQTETSAWEGIEADDAGPTGDR